MPRSLRALAAGLLTVWIPVDAAVAGWWHHHHRAVPVVFVPAFAPSCGGPPVPWGGWGPAVIIDDRPLHAAPAIVFAPSPVVHVVEGPTVSIAPSVEIVSESVVVGPVVDHGFPIDECDSCCDGSIDTAAESVVEGVVIVEGLPTEDATPIIGATPLETVEGFPLGESDVPQGGVIDAPAAPIVAERPATLAEEAPTPVGPSAEPKEGDSVLEPWEPATEKGDTGSAVIAETPADETTDEPLPEDDMVGDAAPADADSPEPPPATDKQRNLFDEPAAPTGEPAPAVDEFDAPSGGDAGFEPPAEGAMEEAPADDMPADEPGFETPADEAPFEVPMDQPPADAVEEPAPPAADPFDSGSLRTPDEPSRTWRDDTGRFSTEGRLVEIRGDRVRILKASGRHTTVPIERLSAADRDHVAGAIRAAAVRPAAGDTAGL